jgi:amino acid transporter
MRDWQGYEATAFAWFTVAFSFVLVVIRLFVDYKGLRKIAWYRDVLIVFAWLTLVVTTALFSAANDYNAFNAVPDAWVTQSRELMIMTLKLTFVASVFAQTCIYCCKVELLFLYHQLAPRAHNSKIFISICIAWVLVIGGYIIFIFGVFFVCRPLNRNWSLDNNANCTADVAGFIRDGILHAFSDMVIYIIPCVIIYRMQHMPRSQKLSAAAMFVMGFVNVLMAVYVLIVSSLTQRPGNYEYPHNLFMSLWIASYLQFLTAFVIVCMPQLKPFYRLLKGLTPKEVDADENRGALESPPREGNGANGHRKQPRATATGEGKMPREPENGNGDSYKAGNLLEQGMK